MMKLLVLAALVSFAAAQLSGNLPMMMMMMRQQQAAGGAAAGGAGAAAGKSSSSSGGMMGGLGSMSGMSRMFNNPMVMCRATENFKPVPCGSMPFMCNMMSMNTYNFPNLMKCSPMGIGCCIKDMQSLIMVQQLA